MKWVRHPAAEAGMKRLGIQWEVVQDIPIESINMELSQERNARIGKKVDEDWVIRFGELMTNPGSEFHMPIMQELAKRSKAQFKYFIWSGNHRIPAAGLAGLKSIDSYIVDVNDLRLMDILPRICHTWEGRGETKEGMVEQARYICDRHGLSAEEVSKMFGIKYEWLTSAVRANGVRTAIEQAGIKADLPKSTLIHLSPLAANRNVLRETVSLLKRFDVAGDRAKALIEDVKRGATELQQLSEVGRWEKLLDTRKPAPDKLPVTRAKRSRFVRLLTDLEKFLDGIKQATQLQLDASDVEIVVKSWDKIAGRMNGLMKQGVQA